MKVRGLDGREHVWRLTEYVVPEGDTRPRSAGHLLARGLLRAAFPFDRPLEEVYVPGCESGLYFDFVLPHKRLIVEIQGVQHRKYVQHFHGTPKGFRDQLRRDAQKIDWCLVNRFTLLALHDDDTDGWADAIRDAFRRGEGEAV